MDRFVRALPHAEITHLTLVDFNHYKVGFFGDYSAKNNYIYRTANAFVLNPHIQTLSLGVEFTQRVYSSNASYSSAYIYPLYFKTMKSLTELILDNRNWDKKFFSNLQKYLSDPACNLEVLELKSGLSADEMTQLQTTFRGAKSLKTYRGPHEEELQAILDLKNITHRSLAVQNEPSEIEGMSSPTSGI